MSYSLSVTMHVWSVRSPRFVARWKETAASLLFCHPTHARGQLGDLYKGWRNAQEFLLNPKQEVVNP